MGLRFLRGVKGEGKGASFVEQQIMRVRDLLALIFLFSAWQQHPYILVVTI